MQSPSVVASSRASTPPEPASPDPDYPASIQPPPVSPSKRAASPTPTGYALLWVAIPLLIGCAAMTYLSVQKVTTHQQVNGKVVRLLTAKNGSPFPEFGYTVGGSDYTATGSSSGLFNPPPVVGDPVVVLVPPNDPGNGSLYRFSDLWFGPLFTGITGGTALGFWLHLRNQRERLNRPLSLRDE